MTCRDVASSDSRNNLPLKCASISRHIIFAITIIVTLAATGYAIYVPVACNDEVNGKDCALGRAMDICTQSLNPIISLSITIIIIGGLLIGVRYTWFLLALGMSIGLEVIYVIPVSVNDNPSHLTARSVDTVFKEMSRCPLTSNAPRTSDSQCWERFRELYCQDWTMTENRICLTFAAECESKNNTWCLGDDYENYRNMTPKQLIQTCVEKYEPWVFSTHEIYYDMALYLFYGITGIHVILFCFMALSIYSYKHFKKQLTETSDVVASVTNNGISSAYRNTLYS